MTETRNCRCRHRDARLCALYSGAYQGCQAGLCQCACHEDSIRHGFICVRNASANVEDTPLKLQKSLSY